MWLPLIILADVGEGSNLNPSNVGVLIQHMDVVVWRNPDDRSISQIVVLHVTTCWSLRHDLRGKGGQLLILKSIMRQQSIKDKRLSPVKC